MLLFLVRHGDPIYSPDSLTPLGKRQSEAVAKRLALYGIDRVYTSTSNRAKETAVPTCELLHKQPEALDWCNESHAWRDFTIADQDGNRHWMAGRDDMRKLFVSPEIKKLGDNWFEHPAFAETNCKQGLEFIRIKSDEFFESHGYLHDRENNLYHCQKPNDERIAIFAHAGFSWTFLSVVLDIPYPMICTHFRVSHSCITVIEFDNKEICIPKILTFSNDSHLYREGLPTKFNNSLYF